MEWLKAVIGKTIKSTKVVTPESEYEDMEILITFADGSKLTLFSSGWSEGVTADGSSISGILESKTS